MLEGTVDMPNFEAWRRALADLGSGRYFAAAQDTALHQIGALVRDRARSRVPRAFGTLYGAVDYEVRGSGVNVGILRDATGPSGRTGTKEYGLYVEKGVRPHAPPPAVLRPWMDRVGYTGSAYLLSRTIARRGIAPKPFLAPALESSQREAVQIAQRNYQAALNQFQGRGPGLMDRVRMFFRGLGGR